MSYNFLTYIPILYHNLCSACSEECFKYDSTFCIFRLDHEEGVREFMYRIVIYNLNICLNKNNKKDYSKIDLSKGIIYDKFVLESNLETYLSELLVYRIFEIHKEIENGGRL